MAVTIELNKLIESGYEIFEDFPIFDEKYREPLKQKIIEHFYFREIGQETPARFKKVLNTKLREIMPYYNNLYKSELMYFSDDNPFDTYNLTETLSRNSTNTSKMLSLLSETPQGGIDINSNDYVSNISKANGEGNNVETYTLSRKGNIGVQTIGYEMKQYREAFLRIDEDIMRELNDCFLLIFD